MPKSDDSATHRSFAVPSSGFHITISNDPLEPVIRIVGDLDARTSPIFDRAFDTATGHAPTRVVVDVHHLTFIDSTGLRSIVRARARSGDKSSFVLRNPQPATLRLLELSGLIDEFTIEQLPIEQLPIE